MLLPGWEPELLLLLANSNSPSNQISKSGCRMLPIPKSLSHPVQKNLTTSETEPQVYLPGWGLGVGYSHHISMIYDVSYGQLFPPVTCINILGREWHETNGSNSRWGPSPHLAKMLTTNGRLKQVGAFYFLVSGHSSILMVRPEPARYRCRNGYLALAAAAFPLELFDLVRHWASALGIKHPSTTLTAILSMMDILFHLLHTAAHAADESVPCPQSNFWSQADVHFSEG